MWRERCCLTCPRRETTAINERLLQSPGAPLRRMNERAQDGQSVLSRGFGALVPALSSTDVGDEDYTCCRVYGSSTIWLIVTALISVPCILAIDLKMVVGLDSLDSEHLEEFFIHDFFRSDVNASSPEGLAAAKARSGGLRHLAAIPFTCAALNFLVQHVRHTTFWWEDQTSSHCDALTCWIMLLATLVLLRRAFSEAVNEAIASHLAFYIDMLIASILLMMYYKLLDTINNLLRRMVLEQEMINKTSPVSKMQNLVRNISRSGRAEKDYVYCFSNTNTVPASVLSYTWWVYYIIGKVMGAGIAGAVFLGADNALITRLVLGGIALSAASAGGAMFELGPNTLSLFRLSLNKPFYVGDLITLNNNGSMEGATSIMGFVENITMMYVVIRNFEMKQTWIPHATFNNMIIQNWTRRPTKTVGPLNIGINCRVSVKKVQALTSFGKQWIEKSEEIQQENYQKCHVTSTSNGYNIEIIFFPGIGVTHRGIRQKFLMAFMAAAQRLKIDFVPLQIMQNYSAPQNPTDSGLDLESDGFVDLDLSDLWPKKGDLLPKGAGCGMKVWPQHKPDIQLPPAAISKF